MNEGKNVQSASDADWTFLLATQYLKNSFKE